MTCFSRDNLNWVGFPMFQNVDIRMILKSQKAKNTVDILNFFCSKYNLDTFPLLKPAQYSGASSGAWKY